MIIMKKINPDTVKNQFGQDVGLWIDPEIIAFWEKQELLGQHVSLRFMATGDSEITQKKLWESVSSEPNHSCWTYLPYTGFDTFEQFKHSLDTNFGFGSAPHYRIEMSGGHVGWVGLLNQNNTHRTIEIGNVYFSHRMKQSTAATEVIFLLLDQCFQHGFRRVEWKCDALNEPSKRAAKRYGFQYEGTFRQHYISKGRNRDTAWFSMVDHEWIKLKDAYLAWLQPENFDAIQQQKHKLQYFIDRYSCL